MMWGRVEREGVGGTLLNKVRELRLNGPGRCIIRHPSIGGELGEVIGVNRL